MLRDFGKLFLLLFYLGAVWSRDVNFNKTASLKYYSIGVRMGIINTEKYSFKLFLRDERKVFKDLYKEYTMCKDSQPLNYEEWLIMNNFGILPDTQRSLFERKRDSLSSAANKVKFLETVRKGDVLITARGKNGFIGHSAIMTTDNWVLEMPGGSGWVLGIKNNNRRIKKNEWFDEHSQGSTAVYRCRNLNAAKSAANWAYLNYYNPSGGAVKQKQIKYRITPDIWSVNPSYCSKLIIQAYKFGTGKRMVINKNMTGAMSLIVPVTIPKYFMPKYTLLNKGQF